MDLPVPGVEQGSPTLETITCQTITGDIFSLYIMNSIHPLFPICAPSLQSCMTLCDPMNCSPPGSSVHGIYPARILEWVAMPSSKGYFQTQGSNPCLLCLLVLQAGTLPLNQRGKPLLFPEIILFLYSKSSPLLSVCCHEKHPSETIPRLEITFKKTYPIIYVTLTSPLESHEQMAI